ncbi:MAG: bifunctional folylpolyglutamate synthase/dihydrofolate synthase [Sphingomonas sanxanigenens]|uniref:Dihydrofolate synthase/folylpolyglutamate synthase n=1 Tax=Sphingomonas sanxanigenens TaxID=397260 RepID=A0A2W5A999_9SPHN|nr:MAG: bifunctional folylpolyglutamate synthase/dihydrofolate synthase [Sphingomonas sanxanigenens]
MDFARSSDPAVQQQLDRLAALSPGRDILGLERIAALLDRLGNPQLRLPPVFHVAGTNGKGSTCAFLRAALEAAGCRVHAYTSPHLVRFNERIRLAGRLIDDALLAGLLAEVLDVADGLSASFFEVTTAAAFLAFARTPADACVIEVGLGGRLDATNVIAHPAVCGIAQLGIDHQAFLGDTLAGIAAEKAGIARAGAPLVTFAYPPDIAAVVAAAAQAVGAPFMPQGDAWTIAGVPARPQGAEASSSPPDHLAYRDRNGALNLPLPYLPGAHQYLNAGLATAMLRNQHALAIPDDAIRAGVANARWPARLQTLDSGKLLDLLPHGTMLLLDGGHNPAAAEAIALALAGKRIGVAMGMLANKDLAGFLKPLAPLIAHLVALPIQGHDHHAPEEIAAVARSLGIDAGVAPDLPAALSRLADPTVMIAGSLYLAGVALEANGTPPD